jgi:hypothetical protein
MRKKQRTKHRRTHIPKQEDPDKEKRLFDEKSSLWGDYRQQSFWNKVSFWSGIASILGLLLSIFSLHLAVKAIYDGRSTSQQLRNIEGQVTHQGSLLPGHQHDPPSACGLLPEGALRLYLGSAAFAIIGTTPTIALKIHGEPMLKLRRTDLGITVSATVRSADGSIIADIVDNSFHVNTNNSFRISRSGESDLTVYDQQGAIALRTEFLNEHSVRITGIFQAANGSTVTVTDNELKTAGGNLFSNICLAAPASPNITFLDIP